MLVAGLALIISSQINLVIGATWSPTFLLGSILESDNSAVSTFGRKLPIQGFHKKNSVNLINLLTQLIMVCLCVHLDFQVSGLIFNLFRWTEKGILMALCLGISEQESEKTIPNLRLMLREWLNKTGEDFKHQRIPLFFSCFYP